jgi:hypothetical protein
MTAQQARAAVAAAELRQNDEELASLSALA